MGSSSINNNSNNNGAGASNNQTATKSNKKQSNGSKDTSSQTKLPVILYHCDFCQVTIDGPRISCVECSEEFDFCVDCFSQGVEIGDHKRNHKYRVVKKHTFPLFDLEWGADEELLLLEAAETYGLGNWEDISEHIGTKTLEECRNHYLETYIASENWPLPNLSQEFDPSIDTLINRRTYKPKKKQYKTLVSQPTNHEIGGFMPGRLEFELEYENEAENIIKDLIINEDDTSDEFNLKLSLLEIYNSKLERREYRKRFCLDRNYFEFKKVQAIEKKRSKEEKAIYSKLKPFTKLQTNSDMENLVNGLLIEDRLKFKISQLQTLITNGLTNMEHLDQFNADLQARTPIEPHAIIDEPADVIQQPTTHNTRSTRQNAGENSEEVRTIGRKQAAPLDISGSDGIELLTQEEQSICSTLRLLPKPYLVIKETLIRECATRGFLRRRQARDLVKIDVNKTSRLYDFFFRMGWVYSTPKQ